MPAASCSSPSHKALTLILLFSLSFVRCTAETVWQIPIEELRGRLERGESAVLAGAEVTPENRGEAMRLGREAPYYLALHFVALGRPEAADQLLRLEWEKGASPWREEAALVLVSRLLGQERHGEAEALARQALRRLRDPRQQLLAERLLIEALYWQQRDAEVLDRLSVLRPRSESGSPAARGADPTAAELWDDELELFGAVAACRLDRPGWQGAFVRLFVESRTGTLHGRAATFLEAGGQLAELLPSEQALVGAKLRLTSEPAEALRLLAEALPAVARQALAGRYSAQGELAWSSLLFETAGTGFASGEHVRAARLLLDLEPLLPPAEGLYARELAGRLLRRGGQNGEAAALLREVISASASASQRDRASWFLLELTRRQGLEAFAGELERLAPGWQDPQYFRDLIEEEISSLAAEGRWRELRSLSEALGPHGPAACRSRLAYLQGRAAQLGLPGAPDRARARSLLLQAWDADPGGYHALLGAALLGSLRAEGVSAGAGESGSAGQADSWLETPPLHDEPEEAARPEEEAGSASGTGSAVEPAAGAGEVGALLQGYLSFGLPGAAYDLLTRRHDGRYDGRRTLDLPAIPYPPALPPELFRKAALRLNQREDYLPSIRLMNRYLARLPGPPGPQDLELLYPRGYARWVDPLIARYSFDPELFYALLREESHFDAGIVSRSGAVGLMQLMEETAADSARRLRLESYDRADPETNLRLGAEHFSRLVSRLESVPKALMAYNAGLSRVRGWERRFSGLPEDLLVEAVPFAETRGYVRKILVSAVQYGRLYYGLDLRATALRFYPELGAPGE